MKGKFLLLAVGLLAIGTLNAQSGRLTPDSTHKVSDTLNADGVWLDSLGQIKTGKLVIVQVKAPMVFQGEDGVQARTDKVGLLSTRYYAAKKEELQPESIIFIRPKKHK